MNTLTKIILFQFRNYDTASFDFNSSVTCITGANGSGKTNLLDAVYYLCYTKSYFSAFQQHSVRNGTSGFRLEGVFCASAREEHISCKWTQGKKEVNTNGVPYEKLTDHIGKFAAVMIAPDDMQLINGGSELRRKWIDSILGQTDREYLERLMHYQKLLAQRNAWLKMQVTQPTQNRSALEFYNEQMSSDAQYIFERRKVFMARYLPLLTNFYEQLSGGKEAIEVIYETDLGHKTLLEWLREGFAQDLRMQRTLKGIHKDDWSFKLNGAPSKQFASQGQKKSFLFALKLAQYAYISMEQERLPILLLDDIFEKLDQSRMEALLKIIRGPDFGQVILTDTHRERVEQALNAEGGVYFINL